ncbi:hypothetical protein [Mesorhizobium sp. CAU 1732]|uniref:hypothetical protein n=1 Tax=Mesorhizobium sp. CAU 1732 TaxID=3140358 RepID=UPI00326046EA
MTPNPAGRFEAFFGKIFGHLAEPQISRDAVGDDADGERVDDRATRQHDRDEDFYWGWNMYGYW